MPPPVTYVIRHYRSQVPTDWRLVGRWTELEPAFAFFRAEAHAIGYGHVVLVNEQTQQTLETIHAGLARQRFA
jgi:hypothetical protein